MILIPLSGDSLRFSAQTFPALARQLADLQPPWTAIGAEAGGEAIGLALGRTGEHAAEISSVFVRPDRRRQGVGTRLLLALEEALASRGATRACVRFSDSLPGRTALTGLLTAAGWPPPEVYALQITGRAGAMAAEGGAWAGVAGRLKAPRGFAFPPLRFEDRDDAEVERLMAQQDWGTHADPRLYREVLDPDCSVAIRAVSDGRLAGWVIAQPLEVGMGPGTRNDEAPSVYYPENYLDAALWSAGLSIGAYFHAFSRQAERHGPRSLAVYRTHPGVARMLSFSRRRFAPMAERVDTVMISRKSLGDAAAEPGSSPGPSDQALGPCSQIE